MISVIALKTTLFISAKNTALTLMLSIPFAFVIASFPDIKTDLVFYGFLGGLTRWAAIKCDWRDGLCGILVGMGMGVGFEGASVPFIHSMVAGEAQQAHCSAYGYGLMGNIIYDLGVSFVRTWKKP